MTWPVSQDYNEAIQSPKSNFADADLQRGEAATSALGIPMPYSGNFADVYQVRCPDGSRWAVKCFTRQAAGLRERYLEISKYLRWVNLPFMVDFTYLEQGIRVVGKWHPVLKMQWVEGLMLNQFVGKYADNPAMMEALLYSWGRMAMHLRNAQVGHCDLQHGNILLVPGASANTVVLKLIDYDGMWVPALAGTRSGEVGHPSYQHPQRIQEGTYSMEVDRFPVLLIATALRALKVGGRALWDRYDNGDNILFKETDLRDPKASALFQELLRLGDPATAALLAPLLKSLWGGLASAPRLEEVMREKLSAPTPNPPTRAVATPTPVSPSRAAVPAAPKTVIYSGQDPWNRGEPAPQAAGTASRPNQLTKMIAGVPLWAWVAAIAMLVAGLGASVGSFLLVLASGYPTPQGPPLPPNGPPVDSGRNGQPRPDPQDHKKDPEKPDTGPGQAPLLDKNVTNSIGMKLVLVPAGKFLMGSPKDEVGRNDDEGPQHEVEITRPFYMGACPVTKGQFAAFMKDAGYQTEAEREGNKETWRIPPFNQTDEHPVIDVTWNDAMIFCQWLCHKEQKTYELPREAEWEYACRAGTTTRFWCGDTEVSLMGNANIADASVKVRRPDCSWAVSWDDKYPFTSPVGKFDANPWGLYDMGGNVRQWCADRYGVYLEGHFIDPRGDNKDERRVCRGGSWWVPPKDSRSACRDKRVPATRSGDFGFRVVLRPSLPAP